MISKFVIEHDNAGFHFALIGNEGTELLRSRNFGNKIDAQMGVGQVREALGDAARQERRNGNGAGSQLILKDKKGAELAHTAPCPGAAELEIVIDAVQLCASKASIVDHAKAKRAAH